MTPEEKIEIMKYQIIDLKNKIEQLERENSNLSSKLHDAEWKIRTELEPRVKEEKIRYDRWVLNQGVE